MAENMDSLQSLVVHASRLKAVVEEAQQAFEAVQEELIEMMESEEVPSVSVVEDSTGLLYTGTVVHSESRVVDEEGLRQAVGSRAWKLVTRRVVDRKKLEAHTAAGDVSADTVAEYTVVKKRQPYVRFTVKPNNLSSMLKRY